jgi:hypothetical protein
MRIMTYAGTPTEMRVFAGFANHLIFAPMATNSPAATPTKAEALGIPQRAWLRAEQNITLQVPVENAIALSTQWLRSPDR